MVVVIHPPYSSDLSYCDFVISEMKIQDLPEMQEQLLTAPLVIPKS
jgi:hypothetical protein